MSAEALTVTIKPRRRELTITLDTPTQRESTFTVTTAKGGRLWGHADAQQLSFGTPQGFTPTSYELLAVTDEVLRLLSRPQGGQTPHPS